MCWGWWWRKEQLIDVFPLLDICHLPPAPALPLFIANHLLPLIRTGFLPSDQLYACTNVNRARATQVERKARQRRSVASVWGGIDRGDVTPSKSSLLATAVIEMWAGSPRMPLSPSLFRARCTLSHPLQLNLFTKVVCVKAYIQEDNGAVNFTNNHNRSRERRGR